MYWKKRTFTSKVQAWTGIKGDEVYITMSYFSTRIDSQNEPYINHHTVLKIMDYISINTLWPKENLKPWSFFFKIDKASEYVSLA